MASSPTTQPRARLTGTFHTALPPLGKPLTHPQRERLARDFLTCARVKGILSHVGDLMGIRDLKEEHSHDVYLIFADKMFERLDRSENVYSVIYAIAQFHAKTIKRKGDAALARSEDIGEESLEDVMARDSRVGVIYDTVQDDLDRVACASHFSRRLEQVGWPSGLAPRDRIKVVKAPGRRRVSEQRTPPKSDANR